MSQSEHFAKLVFGGGQGGKCPEWHIPIRRLPTECRCGPRSSKVIQPNRPSLTANLGPVSVSVSTRNHRVYVTTVLRLIPCSPANPEPT